MGNSNRKISNSGPNYRRFSATDSEAIKRLAAIDSLIEAVSSDQKISKIEQLIDELSEKLREIEQQNQLDESLCDDLKDESNNVSVNTFEKVHNFFNYSALYFSYLILNLLFISCK